MLKVNKKFAKKYDEYRRKEELQKMKDRYGDAKLSEVKRHAAEASAASSASSSSSSESEDSDCEAWTPGMESGFLRVYAALQAGDSRLYDPTVSWFQEGQGEGEGEGEADGDKGGKAGENGEKHKPMYYNEYHRKFLLEGAYEKEDEEVEEGAATTRADMQEAERIRKSLAEAHAEDSGSADSDNCEAGGGGGGAFLTKRRRRRHDDDQADGDGEGGSNVRPAGAAAAASGGGGGSNGEDPVLRLHKFVSDRADDGSGLDAGCKDELARLKRHWTSEARLTPTERYLRDYITKEYWRRRRPSDEDDDDDEEDDSEDAEEQMKEEEAEAKADSEEDGNVSADEAFLARQSEFEARWNGRTEERDPGFEAGYRRTFASGDGEGEGGEGDDDDDEELFVVAAGKTAPAHGEEAGAAAAAADEAEVARELQRLEQRRQWKQQPGTAAGDDEGDGESADEAAAAAAAESGLGYTSAGGIRTYPRRIADSLRQASTTTTAADGARAKRRSERRERRREEKLTKRRELGHLARMKEAELELRLERLRRNAGLGGGGGGGDGGEDRISHTLGGDFLEADFDPAEHDRRMANLFGEDFYGEGEGQDAAAAVEQSALRPQFSDDEELRPDAAAEAEELRRRLQAEVDRLHAEDFIRAGPGQEELRCRFNYRQVEPNDFGLSAAEILLADDRELNAWCSVRKASQYRGRDADWRDRRRYRSARAQERKAQLMPGMLRRLQAAADYADADGWAAAVMADTAAAAAGPDGDADAAVNAQSTTGGVGERKKRRRQQKKMKKKLGTDGGAADGAPEAEQSTAPRSRKRPKLDQSASSVEQQQQAKKKQPKQKAKTAADRLQISEQRLLELGIDPRKFHRMRRSQQQQQQQGLATGDGGGEGESQPQQQQQKTKRLKKRKAMPSAEAAE